MSAYENANELAEQLLHLPINLDRFLGLIRDGQTSGGFPERINLLFDVRMNADLVASWIERNKSASQAISFRQRLDEVSLLAEDFANSILTKGLHIPEDWRVSVALSVQAVSMRPPARGSEFDGYVLMMQVLTKSVTACTYVRGWANEIRITEQTAATVGDLTSADTAEAIGEWNGSDATVPDIPPRAKTAHQQYLRTAEVLDGTDLTDREVYDAFAKAYAMAGEASDLPSLATWQRYLREYRRLTGTQKNTRRIGRAEATKQFAKVEDIEPQGLPNQVRPRWADK